jgi:outer membrane lipoprotein-sorting protein
MGARGRFASILAVLGLVATSMGATGCRSAPACPTNIRVDPARALADHESRRQAWSSLKAEARVTQWGESGRIRGTVLMFLEQPNRVRFDVMTAVGPVAVLTSDGERFQLSDLRAGTFLEGAMCPANIARLLGISVSAEEVLLFLTGDTLVIEGAPRAMQCREGLYIVTLDGADGSTQEIAYSIPESDFEKPASQQRLMLRRSTQLGPEGEKLWEATYDEYADVDGRSFPMKVRFVDHVNGADTEVRVKSVSVDPTIPPDAFTQRPAPGATVEIATCP